MIKKWQKFWCIIMIVIFGIGTMQYIVPISVVQATSSKQKKEKVLKEKQKKALKAYKTFLSASTIDWGDNIYKTKEMSFCCVDVNNDKIPELVVHYPNAYGAEGFQRMYTYVNGKIKKIWTAGNCIYVSHYYKSKGILVVGGGRQDNSYTDYYKVNKKSTTIIGSWHERTIIDDMNSGNVTSKEDYMWKGKTISKKKFYEKLNKVLGTAKKEEIKLVKNTERNRKKKLSINVEVPSLTKTASIIKGKTKNLTVKANGTSIKKISWKSSNKKVAIVKSNGKLKSVVKGVNKGTVRITAKVTFNNKKKTKKLICKITVI